jgi:hypothetical protein
MVDVQKRAGSNAPAQITVALVEFTQTAVAVAARSYWRVLPNPLPLKRNDVLTTMAHLPKPVRVAPLAQPGALGTWPYTPTSDLEKKLFEQSARNLQNRVHEILTPFVREGAPVPVLLEHQAAEFIFSSSDVEQWSREYVLDGVGWILVDNGSDPRAPVRFVLCRPDGTWFPAMPSRPFQPDALAVLESAESEAARYHHDVIGTEHILLAITRAADSAIAHALAELGVSYAAVEAAVSQSVRKGPKEVVPRPGARTSRVRHALETAARVAEQQHAAAVGTEHLLIALLQDARSATTMIAQIVNACGQTADAVIDKLRDIHTTR